MTERDQAVRWRKSSRSAGAGACVEVAFADGRIGVRDSKDPGGPALAFGPEEWAAFLTGIRAGEFDPPDRDVVPGTGH